MAKSRSAKRKSKAKPKAQKSARKPAAKVARKSAQPAKSTKGQRSAAKAKVAKKPLRRARAKRPAKARATVRWNGAAPVVALVTVPAPAPVLAPAAQHDALIAGEQEVSASKFAFAPPAELKLLDERERAQSIPWGYGRDKVTAMAVDPERLFIYWEVTDDAIVGARAELGRSGDDTWLALRVHDVTGLLFDGGNAHHSFDIGVARGDRQWFVQVGRPTSEVIVELGLLARDGRFAPIARSKRVEFPRREPAPAGPVEWLDVRPVVHGGGRPQLHTNRAVTHGPGSPGWDARNDRPWDGGGNDAANAEWSDARGPFWVAGAPWSSAPPADFVASFGASSGSFWHEWATASSHTLQWSSGASRWQWIGPTIVESWESGPVPVEVALPEVVEERFGGDVTFQSWKGFTRVQYGPWRVAIRGLAARGGGRVIARWEVKKSWVVEAGVERFGLVAWTTKQVARRGAAALGGASEELGASEALFAGASERRMLAGSELRLGGGSELFWLGASELNYGGVAERVFGGASERQMAGASERRIGGASEARLGGASEERLGGASEARLLPTLNAPSAP